MLGPYPTAYHARPMTSPNRQLAEYVRWEYGTGTSVESYLAQAAIRSAKARRKARRSLADILREFARTIARMVGGGSRTPGPQV
jgi:hypothetical protein